MVVGFLEYLSTACFKKKKLLQINTIGNVALAALCFGTQKAPDIEIMNVRWGDLYSF